MLGVLFVGLIIFLWQSYIWEVVDTIGILGSELFGILLAFAFAK